MDFLKLTFMFCILWNQIETENVCPNNFSYMFGDKCYSMHDDLKFKYADAVVFCQTRGGILWSRTSDEELEFLTKVHTMIRRAYWTGIRQVGLKWTYLSDNSLATEYLFYKIQNQVTQCQYVETKGDTGSRDCKYELYTACEYKGETCEARKSEGKDCHEFIDIPKNFTSAAETCKLIGGRLAEYRDHNQLLQLKEAMWRNNKAFDDIPMEKIKVSMDSWLPIIWNFKHELQNEKPCEIYLMKLIHDSNCAQSYNFACKFDAIPEVKYANVYINSSKPCIELDTQEAGNNDSLKFSTNMTQDIWRQEQNYTVHVTYLTVAIVGAIIIIVLIITVIIQFRIMRKKGMSKTSSSNAVNLVHTAQSIDMQRPLPERPNYDSNHE